MRRLHFFKDHATHKIQEQERKPEETEDEKPELTSHRQISGDLTEYSVSLDDDNPIWILKVNNKTGSVHAYMSERSIDFDSLDQLYQEWPEVATRPGVNAGFRAMLIDDGHDLPPINRCNDQKINENNGQPNEYHEVPEEGVLSRQIAVCDPDCREYFVKLDKSNSQIILRVNTETNWCRFNVRLEAREFKLEDLYFAMPELPIWTEMNAEIRSKLQADGFVIPETPYEIGYKVTPKD